MARSLALMAVVALAAISGALGCGQVFTRRGLIEAQAAGSPWDHQSAGLDWPETCATGVSQSPINIRPNRLAGRIGSDRFKAGLRFGVAKGARVINTGHAIQVEWDSETGLNASVPVVGNSIFGLYDIKKKGIAVERVAVQPLQFHMHATSEHVVNGVETQIELHLVTKLVGDNLPEECEGTTCLAVFGVMYAVKPNAEAEAGDPVMQKILDNIPTTVGSAGANPLPGGSINLDALLPEDKGYFAYSGSLTTPPCSEGVMWHVMKKTKYTLTAAQVYQLQTAMAKTVIPAPERAARGAVANRLNNRAIQPLNERSVLGAF